MKATLPKLLLCIVSLSAASTIVAAADSRSPRTAEERRKEWSYFFSSLLPTALQSHPLLAISVITEMTDEGKKLPPPTAEKPSYYIINSMGYQHRGHGVDDAGKVPEEDLQRFIQSSFASRHYNLADKDHPATLALFYFWGVHARLDKADLETDMGGFRDVGHRNLLSRAQLVGGTKFAKEFEAALIDRERATVPGNAAPIGIDPVYMFSVRTELNRSLVDQILDDCYFVVVSAYDAGALAKGERKLLWRTKMSTPAQGLSISETIPTLVSSGKSYFGREMNEPTIVDKRINRKGTVGAGELKVIEMDEPTAEKKPSDAPAGKK
ncbi:MAG: hypothetical protein QM715_11580 [Nibricoccus sp.]